MGFSGAWLTQSQMDPQVPLVPGLDPQHLDPTPNPQFQGMSPDWRNTAPAPDLPEALAAPLPEMLATGTGPVDHIDYNNTLAGTGWGHGLSVLDAQDIAGAANLVDDGSYAARAYQPARNPGGVYHAAVIPDDTDQNDSSRSTLLQRTGLGVPTDPDARHANRIVRWFDGRIDEHRWEVAFRPLRPKYARATNSQQLAQATQTSPHTASVVGWNPGSPDRFVTAVVRRQPGAWSQPFDSDGSGSSIVGVVNNYGLPQWGI